MSSHGYPLISMKINGYQWVSIVIHGFPMVSIDRPIENTLIFMEWTSVDDPRISMDLPGYSPWIIHGSSMDIH